MPLPNPLPDAEAQCQELALALKPYVTPETAFVGIFSGGAWIADRVAELLQLPTPVGYIDVSFYRDDYEKIGLHPNPRPTAIPFDVEGRHIILFDDVLESGRTTRAALNVLFDFGRPGNIEMAVLADRGSRQLPICARWCVWPVELSSDENLILAQREDGTLSWSLGERS